MIRLDTMRSVLFILVGVPLSWGQFDDRLWLVQAPASGAGFVLEVARDGSLIGSYPGPQFGSGGVAKDPLLERVWVCDSGYGNGAGQPTGAVRSYRAGQGLTGILPYPGARGIVAMDNGDLAVLLNPSVFQVSRVQLVPWSQVGQGLPPPISVGLDVRVIRAGPGGAVWTLSRVTDTVTLIKGGQSTAISLGGGSLSDIVVLPGGNVLVTRQLSPVATVLDDRGVWVESLTLPEAPQRVVADGDASVILIGASSTAYRVHWETGVVTDAFPLMPGTYGGLIADQRTTFWVEEITTRTLVRYGYGGVQLTSVTLPVATNTLGDPLGLEWAAKVGPDMDVDQDGVPTRTEIYRGSDFLDGMSVPPALIVGTQAGTMVPVSLVAPGREGHPVLILCSLSGVTPVPLSPDGRGGPYYDLDVRAEGLAPTLFANPWMQAFFPGMPLTTVGPGGVASAAVDFSFASTVPPGTVILSCCAVVFEPGFTDVGACSNAVCFDSVGNLCP